MLCQPAAVTVADPDQDRGAGQYGLIPGQYAQSILAPVSSSR